MINWRDAKTNPPTESDLEEEGFIIVFDDSIYDGHRTAIGAISDDKWCRCSEFRTHIISTLDPPDSPWVYAEDRWPTEVDGQHILWMADSWNQPGVHPVCAFSQASHCYRHNLRWMRIPPCPPPKRELPAVAPESFPAFVTLRNGEHAIATRKCPGEHAITILGCKATNGRFGQEASWWYVATGRAMTDKLSEHDIIHVGRWLSQAELEAKRNDN